MLRLPAFVLIAVAAASAAQAADLAGHSRIGALFAEPAAKGRRAVVLRDERPVEEPIVTYAPEVDIDSIVHGYYGKPNSYYYHSYYGTPKDLIFSRAPYGCSYYGYC
jgi:hypothetical protein